MLKGEFESRCFHQKYSIFTRGLVAQLVRALPSHGRGRRFETYQDYQIKGNLIMLVILKPKSTNITSFSNKTISIF